MNKVANTETSTIGVFVTAGDWEYLKTLKSVAKVSDGYVRMSHADMLRYLGMAEPTLTYLAYELGVEYKDMPDDWKALAKQQGWKNKPGRGANSSFVLVK